MNKELKLPNVPDLGGALQVLRKERKLTLEQLASRSGVSKSMLSQIERGKVNPTFAVLWNLTFAMGVDIADLVEGGKGAGRKQVIEHLKDYSTPEIRSRDGKCVLKILSPARTILPMEWYEVTMEPGGRLDTVPQPEGTWEHITVQEGQILLTLSDRVMEVQEGDTIRFGPTVAHEIENRGKKTVKALMVMALPSQYQGKS
ncbi:helix-turn-helix domain-containing protein [Aestuariispira insulae]|uniref:XRE family transcriptional regulator n=1 Tax=Aestuariispira insulae TaxID=1461337 RepID=A0A3D9HMP4_9PROT|nr:XRE family transcriptional regulator [Aestuariispira insulae]RED50777.1 XRE family transcriptional regulator [Aestuariispira insulae]